MEISANLQKPQASASSGTTAPAANVKTGDLDSAKNTLAIQMLQQLRLGFSQALLYEIATKQFEKVSENVFAAMNNLLESIGDFTLIVSQMGALINGERVKMPRAARATLEQIEKVLNAASISSLCFEKSLIVQELGKFLQILARKKFGSDDVARIRQYLRDQDIVHIRMGELHWVSIGVEQKVVSSSEGGMPGLANFMAQTAVGGTVDSFIKIFQHVNDHISREQLRAEVTEQLLQKDPHMLGNLLITAIHHLKDPVNEQYREMVALPQRDNELLNAIIQLAKPLAEKGLLESSGSADAMRDLIALVVEPYQSRAEDILTTVPFEPTMATLFPDWLAQAYSALRGGSAVERLAGILTQSPNALLDEQMFTQIVDVLDELSVAGKETEAKQLMTHISGALQAVTKSARATAVQRLSSLLDRSMEQTSAAVNILENALLEVGMHETCDEVMQLLLAHLSKRCEHHYKISNFDRALEHLRWITRLEESSRVAMRDENINLARHAREALAKSDFGKRLAQDLLGNDPQAQTARQMAQILGKDVWLPIVAQLGIETDPQITAAIVACLPVFGKEAAQQFFTMLEHEQSGPATLRLLTLAHSMGDESQVAGLLPTLLRHTDEQVRNHTLALIRQRDDEFAVNVLVETLHKETDTNRRRVLVVTLTQLQHGMALTSLLAELETAINTLPMEEAFIVMLLETLNSAGKQEIIPIALKLVAPRGHTLILTAIGPHVPKSVMMAAIKVLGRFFKDPTIAETLERLRQTKDPDIARLALVAARGIVATETMMELPSVPAPSPVPLPVPTTQAASATQLRRKTHRAFEVLEEQIRVESILKLGSSKDAPVTAVSSANKEISSVPSVSKPWLKGIKPVMEGLLQELDLSKILLLIGNREGVLKIDGSASEGLIFVKNRLIADIFYAGRFGIEALAAIDSLKDARFSFFVDIPSPRSSINLEVSEVQNMLKMFRENRQPNGFY
ncbi:MAG: DUF4388 domain-containing protein [Planctomycetota bacterium]